ncbi:heme ABC transporter ATP-binding protein [Microbacterium sp. JB110]|nr:heme ABC transporter ATP-binding protein [Microbacterium sp. JB110]RCS60031.1 heme ABC transporter ATP-binding protein [Microbacterium sp. JB110]
MTDAAFRLTDVGCGLGGRTILSEVALDIRRSHVLALVGPNGAGKSTLLGVLTGDVRSSSGEVLLADRPLDSWGPRVLSRTRAVLLQDNAVTFSSTARQVVEIGRAPWIGVADAEADERAIDEAMRSADVIPLASRSFPALSGGERAHSSLARVLAQDTDILLLDEPTAALDLRHQEEIMRLARRLARGGRAVVVVLHDLSLVGASADEVAVFDGGTLRAHGAPDEVLDAELTESVYGTPVRVVTDPGAGKPIVLPRREG